jgi:basic amino acid/polyamine antiporter, APA family
VSLTTNAQTITLRRELGRWDLTAIGVNQVIGAAVFAQPALLAARAGAWSPWLVAAVGLASMAIALSFAEVGSRFEGTGGSYLYTRAAFGRFAAFEVGWMLWFTRVSSWAAVINVLATYLGYYWPAMTTGWPRAAVICAVIAAITLINVRGIRQSSLVVNVLTVGKLLPLTIFIIAGLIAIDPARLALIDPLPTANIASTALLLVYGFGGYEVIPVVAGETKSPTRAVPFALIMTLAIVSVILTLAQVVAIGTLPSLATSATPLADAAGVFLGAGAAMMTLATTVSVLGNNMGGALSGSRNLFALAEQGDVPPFFGRIHPRFRTPLTAILITAGVALVLAVSGRFAALAAVSAVSRLIVYAFTCAATLRLRHPRFAAHVRPASFVVPLGPVIPALALMMALAIIAGATPAQLRAGVYALVAGAVLYAIALRRSRPLGQSL